MIDVTGARVCAYICVLRIITPPVPLSLHLQDRAGRWCARKSRASCDRQLCLLLETRAEERIATRPMYLDLPRGCLAVNARAREMRGSHPPPSPPPPRRLAAPGEKVRRIL